MHLLPKNLSPRRWAFYTGLLAIMMIGPFGHQAVAASPDDYQVVTPNDETERRPRDLADHDVVVLVADPDKRAPLEHATDACNGRYYFSPDARWLFASYGLGSGMARGEVFAHRDGPRFAALDPKKPFSDLAWEFCFKQRGEPIVKPDDADAQLIDYVGWSPDNARLLVSLRGGTRHGDGVYAWNVYWNTRTRAFELTDYLRALNRAAARRWTDDDFRENSALAACAEPLAGGSPSQAAAGKSYADADRRLNQYYATHLGKQPAKDRKSERNSQREWLKRRDEGARVYAGFGGDAAEKELRRLQYLTGATEQRTIDLGGPDSQ